MTGAEAGSGDTTCWEGRSRAVGDIRDVLVEHAPAGSLRIVLQQITLREGERVAGVHEVIDAVGDVGGNLVAIPLAEAVRADAVTATRLDAALARLRQDLAEDLGREVDGLELSFDADGHRHVRYVEELGLGPQDLADDPDHPAVHGGPYTIRYFAPVLDDLRDRLEASSSGRWSRWRESVVIWLRNRF